MIGRDVKPEIEAFDPSHIFQAAAMVRDGRLKAPVHNQFVMGVKNAMPVDRPAFEFLIETTRRLMLDATWCAAGIGRHQATLNAWCAELGGHCHTWLKDNIRFDRKRLAPSNAALVGLAVDVCQQQGRRPATVAEARAFLSLPPAA